MIRYPLLSEKAIDLIERQNKLVFLVENKATKMDVKKEVEELYKVKVANVNILNDRKGNKKAYVKLGKNSSAADLATQLNIM